MIGSLYDLRDSGDPQPTLGLFAANMHACAGSYGAARIATLAESLGYDSLWVADHVVVPRPRVEPSPMEPTEPLLDPVVALTHLAANTDRIRLATGCIVLPQRNPLVLAKQLASLDVLSGGRLIFGMAVGYLEPEMRAVGVPMSGRGSRADEHLQAMRALWHSAEPSFHGRHVDFDGVDAHPRPLQEPLPVVVGGHSPAAHRRALRYADGWYGWLLDLPATRAQLDSLREASVVSEANEASAHDGRRGTPLHISVSPARRLDPDVVRAYAELGVDRLVVVPQPGLSLAELERFVERNAPHRVGARPLGRA